MGIIRKTPRLFLQKRNKLMSGADFQVTHRLHNGFLLAKGLRFLWQKVASDILYLSDGCGRLPALGKSIPSVCFLVTGLSLLLTLFIFAWSLDRVDRRWRHLYLYSTWFPLGSREVTAPAVPAITHSNSKPGNLVNT